MTKRMRRAERGDGLPALLIFQCPGCDAEHYPNETWSFNGDFERPTLTPSVKVTGATEEGGEHVCHSHVKDGRIQFLGDSTHALAGQIVDLPALEE